MTDKATENPSAFPVNAENSGGPGAYAPEPGMTLRDWFAGQADVSAYSPRSSFELAYGRLPTINELADYIRQIRFLEADAMLAARAQEKPHDR